MIWLLYLILVSISILNIVQTIRLQRSRSKFLRMVGYHQKFIVNIRAMEEARELNDVESLHLFFRRYQAVSSEYDDFLNVK